ncbi:bacteriocin [Clostridium beijerinckii]|nr:bacteriocin [Clostridium beijerinckii]
MKHEFFKKLIVAAVITSTIITLAPVGVSAAWVKNDYGNWSYTEGYRYATGWRQISGNWYFFDDIGQMRTGWINSNGEWYYIDLSGIMQTGVIQIEGKIYVFTQSGEMQKGNCIVNGILYNIDDNGVCIGTDVPMPIKGFDYYGNSTLPYVPSQIVSDDIKMSSDIPSDGSKQVKQYKVKFKDPYAEDSDDELLKTRTIDEDTNMTLYKPTKSGYAFVEWNTDSDGDSTSYEYDDKIKIKKDITLYAQWEVDDSSTAEDTKKVEAITVSDSNNLAKITTKSGSLQMTKKVYPNDATDQTVTWSVSNNTNNTTGEATISTSGKLTAVSNGTVTVKATAKDGSGVYDEFYVKITGQ